MRRQGNNHEGHKGSRRNSFALRTFMLYVSLGIPLGISPPSLSPKSGCPLVPPDNIRFLPHSPRRRRLLSSRLNLRQKELRISYPETNPCSESIECARDSRESIPPGQNLFPNRYQHPIAASLMAWCFWPIFPLASRLPPW